MNAIWWMPLPPDRSMEPLLAKLREVEDRKKSLIQELERLSVADQVTFLDDVKLKREVKDG